MGEITVVAVCVINIVLLCFGWKGEARYDLNRSSFPQGFIFGTASAAYQYEGGAREGGRGPSIWDTFTHLHPEKIDDHSNGDVAEDSYHRYKEDVRLMKAMEMDAYRFSISWTRILPNGRLSGGVNRAGVNYYNNLINELLSKGIKPFVTLFHWDSPQSLEDLYSGFLSPNIVEDYVRYAEVCFSEFGDRVKHWITFNEPLSFCSGGYATGSMAPGRQSNSATEPYSSCHRLLLAHGAAVRLYRQKYQTSQRGTIGITLNPTWCLPYSSSKSDADAQQRTLDFSFGWFMDPLTVGDYPFIMRALVAERLPKFTKTQSDMVKGSFDFIGVNYYSSSYAIGLPVVLSTAVNHSYTTDSRVNLTEERNGIPIGPRAASRWLYIYPPGIRKLLLYIKNKYNDPIIYITENAISEGVNVKGYFAWSLLDNFEWGNGYTVRFGINFVDYENGLKRYPKKSASWFKQFLARSLQ